MSAPELTDRDRLAAEHALRLLEGEELLQARGLMASDAEFATDVSAWEQKLGHLQGRQTPVTPSADLWSRIEAEIADAPPAGEVVSLQRRVRQWQVASVVSAAAAIALAVVAVPAMQASPEVPVEAAAPLMANVPIADTGLRLAVTYLPDDSEMLISANGLSADGVHDHELWLVVPDGVASLGVVVPGEQRRVTLSADIAKQIESGSDILLSREPLGGAPEGEAPGPVVAEGEFTTV